MCSLKLPAHWVPRVRIVNLIRIECNAYDYTTCFLCHISNALYCGVILWSSRVMQKPADKHGEKVSIYNLVPAELPWVACIWLYIAVLGVGPMCCFCAATPTRLPKHGAERHCQSAGWSVRCRLRVVVNINFIRASIIANYFHWRERTRALQTRYFISQGVHGIFLALSAKRVTHDWKLTLPNWFCVTWQRKIRGCDCDI